MPNAFRQLFDPETATYTYLLADPDSGKALLIDPVRDQLERDERLLDELGLTLTHTIETHVHADHVTSSGVLRMRRGSRSIVSAHGGANCADVLVDDGDMVETGCISLEIRATPGHTNGCISVVDHEGRRVFTGDTLLIRGTGRTDFQDGDPHTLYRSIHDKIFSLPDDYAIYPGHDYRGFTSSSVAEEKAHNRRVGQGKSEAAFVDIMNNLKLAYPKRIDEAVPANLQCGIPFQARMDGVDPQVDPGQHGWAPLARREGVPELTVGWVADHLDDVRLVDVRRDDEWAEAHVGGAEHVVLEQLEGHAAGWDREAPVVLMCRTGARSGRAAMSLENLGFRRVASMAGGIVEWSGRDLPVQRGQGS